MKYTLPTLALATGLFFFSADTAVAQKAGLFSKKKKKEQPKEEKKEEDKYADLIKKCSKSEGLFTLYRDTVSGKTYLEVRADQLDKEYIYFNHIVNAPVESGYFTGSFGDSKIVRFKKEFEKMWVIQENTNFYFDENNNISKAADANINDPVLAGEKIEAVKKDKSAFLIDGDGIFLSEKFQLIKYPSSPGGPPSVLGSLSSSKSKVERINNYPENTEVTVNYVYENSSPTMNSDALADARNISITYQHSLLQVPASTFQPRFDDPRIGYFSTNVTDLTSFEAANYKDVIHRWHLEKKDKGAALSEPVKPITFWIENTTPAEFRPIIKEACERWNVAFEKAGFKNAVVCLEQPNDATWDAGDIRYNVLRWTSTPQPPFGGYGPSFVNPRTGEILGADIMLEFVAIINRVNAQKVFKSTGFLNDAGLEEEEKQRVRNPFLCQASNMSNHNFVFAAAAAQALGADDAVRMEVANQLLYRLVLHEVGHTLGLTHNMRASTMSTMEDVKNPQRTRDYGLANSIMEYPAFNYQLNPAEQGLYCDVNPGPYDLWVIEYGYSEAANTPEEEASRLKKITDRSTDPRLAYGNDADDMRGSGRGIDPDVNIYDLTNDPVAYAADRCEMVKAIMPELRAKLITSNESYEELVQAYLIVSGEYANQLRIMTRQIGGVHYDRSYAGQKTSKTPFEPVAEAKQKAAMKALEKYAFAPDAFNSASVLYKYLLEQRRGFAHFSENQDPDIHERVLAMQKECMSHLLHPNVLERITDSQLYGGTYSIDEVLTDLTNALFAADSKGTVNTFRQNAQVEYVQRLIKLLDVKSNADHVSRSMALAELRRIDSISATGGGDALTKAHREHLRLLVKKALES